MPKSPPTDIDAYIGQRLKLIRQRFRISAEKLGENLGVSQQQLSRWELGANKISASQLFNIAQVFQVPVTWFFLGYESTTPYPAVLEPPQAFDYGIGDDELTITASQWKRLTHQQRKAILHLMDTFLVQ